MNYHNITHDDMLNGEGLRVVLWVAGCENNCKGCQNPETHDPNGGIPFDIEAGMEIAQSAMHSHCAGLTISGGDPLYPGNVAEVTTICKDFKDSFPDKTVWLYTGYTWEQVKDYEVMQYIDVLCEGRFVEELADENCKWVGSTNQRVINVPESLKLGKLVLEG